MGPTKLGRKELSMHAASRGRDTNPGHNITRFGGLQSLCGVLSTVPAGATECPRCFRDFTKEDRHGTWGRQATALNSVPKWEILGRAGRPFAWLHNSLGQTVDKAITMFFSKKKKTQSHHLSPSHSPYSSWLVFHGDFGERTTEGCERHNNSGMGRLV